MSVIFINKKRKERRRKKKKNSKKKSKWNIKKAWGKHFKFRMQSQTFCAKKCIFECWTVEEEEVGEKVATKISIKWWGFFSAIWIKLTLCRWAWDCHVLTVYTSLNITAIDYAKCSVFRIYIFGVSETLNCQRITKTECSPNFRRSCESWTIQKMNMQAFIALETLVMYKFKLHY